MPIAASGDGMYSWRVSPRWSVMVIPGREETVIVAFGDRESFDVSLRRSTPNPRFAAPTAGKRPSWAPPGAEVS